MCGHSCALKCAVYTHLFHLPLPSLDFFFKPSPNMLFLAFPVPSCRSFLAFLYNTPSLLRYFLFLPTMDSLPFITLPVCISPSHSGCCVTRALGVLALWPWVRLFFSICFESDSCSCWTPRQKETITHGTPTCFLCALLLLYDLPLIYLCARLATTGQFMKISSKY